MKKFLTYILILVALTGTFSSTLKVFAQTLPTGVNLTGTCYYGTDGVTDTNSNASECIPGQNGAISFTPNPLGDCTVGNGAPQPNYTRANCVLQGSTATWTGYYNLLEPLPNPNPNGPQFTQFNPSQPGVLSAYLNPMISLFIGLCAVLAMIMVLYGGIEYMTSELISNKEAGKERIRNALLGLLLALGAWAILNTINPNLLNTNVNIANVNANATITNFPTSGAQSINGQPGPSVSFQGAACPTATAATQAVQAATGVSVDPALVLAVYSQESSSGVNTGSCSSDGTPNANGQTANMSSKDVAALTKVLAGFGQSGPVYVSCSGGGSTNGGAMGPMQVTPSTWLASGGAGQNPWNLTSAMTVAATNLAANESKQVAGLNSSQVAACYYFSGSCSQNAQQTYVNSITNKMTGINAQIANGGCN